MTLPTYFECTAGHHHTTPGHAEMCIGTGDLSILAQEHTTSLRRKTGGGRGGWPATAVHTPECTCGWSGSNATKRAAGREAHDHVRMQVKCPVRWCSAPAGEWCNGATGPASTPDRLHAPRKAPA